MCYWKVTVLKHQQGNLRLLFRLLNSDVQNPNMRLTYYKPKISLRDFLFLTSTSSWTLLIQIGILDFIFYKAEYLLNAQLFVQAIFIYNSAKLNSAKVVKSSALLISLCACIVHDWQLIINLQCLIHHAN